MKAFLKSLLLKLVFAFDKATSESCFRTNDGEEAGSCTTFSSSIGRWICAVTPEGRIRWSDRSWSARYYFREGGSIDYRVQVKNDLIEGDRLVIGDEAIRTAYLASPEREEEKHRSRGGFDC